MPILTDLAIDADRKNIIDRSKGVDETWLAWWTHHEKAGPAWIDRCIKNGTIVVALDGPTLPEGKIVGHMIFTKMSNIIYITEAVVDKEYQRKGIGRMMVEYIEDIARRENFDRIMADTWDGYEHSKKCLTVLGFQKVGRMTGLWSLPEDQYDIWMKYLFERKS